MRAKFCIHGDPQGKGRPRFSTVCGHVHTRTPDETVLYENLVKTEYRQQVGVKFPDDAMLDVRIFAYYPIPKSVSKRKRQAMLENPAHQEARLGQRGKGHLRFPEWHRLP